MVMTQKEQSRSAARPHVVMWPCCGGYEEPCGPVGRADSLPPTPVVALHGRGKAGGRQVALPAARIPVFRAVADSSTASFDMSASSGYNSPIAPHARYGIGLPVTKADGRHRAVFFRPSHGKPVMGGLCGGSFGCAGSFVPVDQPRTVPLTLIGLGAGGIPTDKGIIAMAHKARIPSSATALDTNPELINAYQLNGIDNKLDDIYQFVRYVSKQVFRNAIKRELCAGLKLASLLDLPAKDVTVVMQWLERLRNDAISNYVATSALEQRFLNQWLENIGPHPLQESKGAA